MNLLDIANAAAQTVQLTDEDSLAFVKGAISRRYRMLWDAALWRDTLWVNSVSVDAAQSEVLMPEYCGQVVAVMGGTHPLAVVHHETLFRFSPDFYDWTGDPWSFVLLPPVVFKGDLGTITISAAASGDIGTAVDILYGYSVQGTQTKVRMTLTAAQQTVGAGDMVLAIGKPVTSGNVTVTKGSDTWVVLASETAAIRHPRIRLLPVPTVATTLSVLLKKRCVPLENDYDEPELDSLGNALVAFATADLYEYAGQNLKAQAKAGEAMALLEVAKQVEVYQRPHAVQFLPAAEAPANVTGSFGKWA